MAKKKTTATSESAKDPLDGVPKPEETPKAPARKPRAKADAPKAAKPRGRKATEASAAPSDELPAPPPRRPTPAPAVWFGIPELADGVNIDEFYALVHCTCWDPHRLLGCHAAVVGDQPGLVVRAWHPDAETVEVIPDGEKQGLLLKKLGVPGVFGLFIPGRTFPFRYKLRYTFRHAPEWVTPDPYNFLPSLGDLDIYLHGEGNHLHAYRKFGAQYREMNGVWGVAFCLWAPNARRVSVIGEFNHWDGRLHPMRSMGSSGVWELFVPGAMPGMGYKFEILTQDHNLRYKADPYAFAFDLRPSTHSKVHDQTSYEWKDAKYMARLEERRYLEEPMAVYEVHLGSWMRVPEEGNRWLNYRELAERLAPHCKRYGFTHIELLPVAEHPFDGSWGYQVTGYYAPTSRFGTPDDFKYFVDYMHQHGLGVIVDWVPAHFPRDDFALRWFDGTPLYEHADPRRGEHKDWGTLIFDYGRPEVKNFLLSNALYWLDMFHVDGLRVDAVASMLYLDYSRQPGEWLPNKYGGRENLEAIAFLRQLNEVVHGQYPGRFTVAEESTAFPGVSRPTYMGGLGFTFKWNMGWMNDTLRYFAKDPIFRKYHQNDLTFALVYQFTENFMLPFSHDEVVHGKGSMIGKMPGDRWQKFANLRLLYSYLYAHPGKKLLFMGSEFGQNAEWHYDRSLDWHEAGDPLHGGVESCLATLGWLYRDHREFWIFDNDPIGFRWIDFNDHESSVLAFVRQGPEGHTVCVFNFTPIPRFGYRIGMPAGGKYKEVFNSDAHEYGGGGVGNYGQVWTQDIPLHGNRFSAHVNIPPLGAVFLKHEG
ncbi:1,4-alpha-glucan branching protein GlgB [bacterium]|nr:1,4-alpha-glucan branching protein GlgB [bacterium]